MNIKVSTIFKTAAFIFGLLFILVWVLPFSLTVLLNRWVIPQVLPGVLNSEVSATVRYTSWSRMDISDIAIPQKGIAIQSLGLDFSVPGLLNRHIKKIDISGVGLKLPPPSSNPSKKTLPQKRILPDTLPVTFGEVHISDINASGEQPFLNKVHIREVSLSPHKKKENALQVHGHIDLSGQPVETTAQIFFSDETIALSVATRDFYISSLHSLTGGPYGGIVDANFSASLDLKNTSVADISADISVKDAPVPFIHKEKPLHLRIHSPRGKNFSGKLSGFEIPHPFMDLKTTPVLIGLNRLEDRYQLKIASTLAVQTKPKAPLYINLPETNMPVEINADYMSDGTWSLSGNLSTPKIEVSEAEKAKRSVSVSEPSILLSASGNHKKASGTVKIITKKNRFTQGDTDISFSGISAEGKADVSFENTELSARYKISLEAGAVKRTNEEVNLGGITISGQVKATKNKLINAEALLQIKDSSLHLKNQDIILSGVSWRQPLAWPQKSLPGKLTIPRVLHKKRKIASCTLALSHHKANAWFKGSVKDLPVSDTEVVVFGSASLYPELAGSGNISIKRSGNAPPVELGEFNSSLAGATLSGGLSGSVDAVVNNGIPNVTGVVSLENGSFQWPDKNIDISGIRTQNYFDDLVSLRSRPGQQTSCSQLIVGNLKFNDISIATTIESPESFLVENMNLSWCGGNITTRATRLNLQKPDIDTVFYCDRVALADLLNQLGVAKADGEGVLSGTIPVRVKDKQFQFGNGVLFSSPGSGGVIYLASSALLSDQLSAAAESDSFSQLDIAIESLKAYEYKWAKIYISSEKDAAHIELMLDGKPLNSVPFTLNKETGTLVRVSGDHPGALIDGIRLDMDFIIPVNELLGYGDIMSRMNQ